MRYLVMIRRTATGYSVDVPDLPGCVATAKTIGQARRRISQAIGWHVDLMRRSGESPPQPSRSIEFAIDDEAGEELCTWVDVEEPAALPSSGT